MNYIRAKPPLAARLEKALPFQRANRRRSPDMNSEVHEKGGRQGRVAYLLIGEGVLQRSHSVGIKISEAGVLRTAAEINRWNLAGSWASRRGLIE